MLGRKRNNLSKKKKNERISFTVKEKVKEEKNLEQAKSSEEKYESKYETPKVKVH